MNPDVLTLRNNHQNECDYHQTILYFLSLQDTLIYILFLIENMLANPSVVEEANRQVRCISICPEELKYNQ
ncbi:hypothetical protein [Legionella antarctica]|uniref:hypothetical protein n=1 Tax=Legionella antarctica TaxID=2708020 RepID=UPI001567689B|nr:hypothetical protein [Legionella antarctica]